ncbi:DUF6929 family protein [Flavobacterium sp.]
MENFQLSLFLKIVGIGSASGLVYQNDRLYIISDNSTFLYEYKILDEKLIKIALVDNPQENISKKEKPDFEAITAKGTDLIILGSGSTQNRTMVIDYKIKSGKVKTKNITDSYTALKNQLNIKDDELNIEGLIIDDQATYFFQRGNGEQGKNGIIYSEYIGENPIFKFFSFDLPHITNVATTFTDAILVKDKIYFLAAAEDTHSTYLDGEVLGSSIGKIDLKTMKLENYIQISNNQKFEGITLFKQSESEIQFLLCEDNDSEDLVSAIYKVVISL